MNYIFIVWMNLKEGWNADARGIDTAYLVPAELSLTHICLAETLKFAYIIWRFLAFPSKLIMSHTF